MTEFLKNNPIALRHCLLYLFLEDQCNKKCFENFCKVVGEDVIDDEEFLFWFDRFRRGKFNANKEPITNMRDFIRSDKKALRACILYDSLKYRNCGRQWAASHYECYRFYKSFCKVIGEDSMDYQEYEHHFYRFIHGKNDLCYEIDHGKKAYKINDIPNSLMKCIVADLDLLTRLALISTCRFFRKLTMTQPFLFEELVLKIEKDKCQVNIGDDTCGTRVTYTKDGKGCIKSVRSEKQLIEGVSHWKQAALDVNKTLQLPNLHIERLHIGLVLDDPTAFHMATREIGLEPFGAMINGVRARTNGIHLLKVERLIVDMYYLEHLQKVLLSLTPGYLKSICIIFWPLQHRQIDNKVQYDAMAKVVETEQWKQAEEFSTNLPFTGPLHHLSHFKKFDVRYPDLSIEDFRQMKEFLVKSPNFKQGMCRTGKSAVDTIKQESKEVRPFYRIPHHTEKYFIIDFQSDARLSYIKFTKK
ncbi:unnamed protein product [Caenorhabditis brenneri]